MEKSKGIVWYCAERPKPVLREHNVQDLWVQKKPLENIIHRWDGRDWVNVHSEIAPKTSGPKTQLYPSPRREERAKRRQAKRETFPFAVDYDLAYDGGGSAFTQYYRSRAVARWCAFWNVRISSWGGSAVLRETENQKTTMKGTND